MTRRESESARAVVSCGAQGHSMPVAVRGGAEYTLVQVRERIGRGEHFSLDFLLASAGYWELGCAYVGRVSWMLTTHGHSTWWTYVSSSGSQQGSRTCLYQRTAPQTHQSGCVSFPAAESHIRSPDLAAYALRFVDSWTLPR